MSNVNSTEKKENLKTSEGKKKMAMPDVYVILFGFLLLAFLASYILPAGTYERAEVNGIMQVVPNSFQYIDTESLSIMDVFTSIQVGLAGAGGIIFLIIIVGGIIRVIEHTGAISSGIHSLIQKSKGNHNLLIFTFCSIFALISSLGVAPNLAIAFVPIGIMLARTLKLDPIVGVSMVFLGAYAGFSGGVFDPVVTVMGQTIAGLPLFSGALYRMVIFVAFLSVTIAYICIYAKKVRQDPSKSLMGADSFKDHPEEKEIDATARFTNAHKVIILLFFVTIGGFLYGALQLDWSINELSAVFLMLGIAVALVAKITPNQFVKVFMGGASQVMYGALLVGVAGAIIVLLDQAQVVDTIVNGVVAALINFTPVVSMVLLYGFNLVFNGIITSGTGQAAIVMPIMVPIGDMLEVTRQSTFITFKMGDAVTNIITPLSGTLMACLAIAKVSYVKWVKFVFPLLLIWVVLGGVFVAAAVWMDYGPF
ncbi:YfcC family protein [Planococcus sp. CPCC 101016]|uniref:YfcC family protein n=1 Tax=Planococcus sp. CPCC 101016 TaxID=2599617 RepID=UPI0011B6DCCC|nr:AbgT family transporter [Planococcus sp. CPCC 101016]TWT08028.1 YfcC family protein [Planococcus sp. CPCC 101016]